MNKQMVLEVRPMIMNHNDDLHPHIHSGQSSLPSFVSTTDWLICPKSHEEFNRAGSVDRDRN